MKAFPIRRIVPLVACLAWLAWVFLGFEKTRSCLPLAEIGLVGVWLLALTVAAAGPGLVVWRWVSGGGPLTWDAVPVVLASGAGALAGSVALLSPAGWLRPAPVNGLLLGALVLGAWQLSRQPLPRLSRLAPGAVVPAIGVAAALAWALVMVVTDAPFYDQLHYHLAFPFHWLRHGTIFVLPRHQYSYVAGNMSLLYCFGLAGPGVWAAQATHLWMGGVAVGAVAAVARRMGGPRAAWWSAALLATTPVVVTCAALAAADLGATAWGMAGVLALVLGVGAEEASRRRWVLLAGLLAGLAIGAKILAALTIAIPAGVVLLLVMQGGWRPRLRMAILWGVAVMLATGGWLARNWVNAGHPLHPFMRAAAPVHAGPLGGDPEPRAGQQIAGIVPPWTRAGKVLTLTTFDPEGDAGPIGPLYLALAPVAFWLAVVKRRVMPAALVAGGFLGVVGWGIGPLWGRYLIPILALLAAALGWCWVKLRSRLSSPLRLPADLLLGGVLLWVSLGAVTPVQMERLSCSLGVGSSEELMRRHASYWPAVRFVNRELPADARLLMVAEARGMYLDRELIIEDPFQTPLLVELANASRSTGDLERALRARGVTHLLMNWHEADRMAVISHRADFFADLGSDGRRRMMELRQDRLRTIFSEGPVEVLAWR